MGIYLNPNNMNFQQSINSEIYVDKSMLIKYANKVINTEQKYICVSRPRRFGKSMAANMLSAYYSKGCNSQKLFSGLKIYEEENFEEHLNKYNVIHLNMQNFLSESENIEDMIKYIEEDVMEEIEKDFSNVEFPRRKTLPKVMAKIFDITKISFIFIIDEWDCIFRLHKTDGESQKKYLDFLRGLLKDQSYVALAYMTGILPIKKYGIHSAINVFYEYSMTNSKPISEFTGFTEEEVNELCNKYSLPIEEIKRWYDGYCLDNFSVYNPKSVVEAMIRKQLNNYWTSTETYEALKVYIEMNCDGLRDIVVELLSGNRKEIDTTTFSNDMITFKTADDVLTLLIHLGYLGFDFETKEIFIPNYEISEQFISTIKILGWNEVVKSIQKSEKLLEATLKTEEKRVEEIIEEVHKESTSILKYNDENSLSCVISLAYYSARKSYILYREMQAGKGYADLVFVPRKNCTTPAFIVELKYDKTASTAIEQIKQKQYCDCLKDYKGKIIIVGINYDKNNKVHECKIEELEK